MLASAADGRVEQRNPAQRAVYAQTPAIQRFADGAMLAHAGMLVACGVLALRARERHSAYLRFTFRMGIPLIVLCEVWNFSQQWAPQGLMSGSAVGESGLKSLFLALGAVWGLTWSAFKSAVFLWSARYLNRESKVS